jgi:hypothetical protein
LERLDDRGCTAADRPKRRGGNRDGAVDALVDFRTWFERARRTSYLIGLHPGEFLDLTPGELNSLFDCWQERQESEWLRFGALAEWMRGQIWGKEGHDRYQLTGLSKPEPVQLSHETAKQRWMARWTRITDAIKRGRAG